MAVEKGPYLDWTVLANSDLSGQQYHFVKFHGTATIDAVVGIAAATDLPLGLLQNTPGAGEEADCRLSGISKAIAGGTITRNDLLTIDATGAVVKATIGTDTTKYVVGRALESGVAGQVVSIILDVTAPYLAK
jgi:hypothetical protein